FFLLIIFVVRLHKNFNLYEAFLWFAYDFMGIRLIVEKIFPSNIKNKKEKPSSFHSLVNRNIYRFIWDCIK
ncbi:MAG: hypothetical protein U9N47_06850, partial [Thermodesulfobacteriota bacterium]|nr:hypothetical protein [Thermodesulfobacteriota bacterium]